jgi:hypothetical protein
VKECVLKGPGLAKGVVENQGSRKVWCVISQSGDFLFATLSLATLLTPPITLTIWEIDNAFKIPNYSGAIISKIQSAS